ncbi:glycine-rich domain-containing protein [Streptomyces sp. NPDC054933]
MSARDLLTTTEFDAVLSTVARNNPGMPTETAGQIVEEGLKFVATAAQFRTVRIAPSRVVDEGWHALILHTRLYAALCERLGGFVHHYPEPGDPSRHNDEVMARTVALIGEAGYMPDVGLWRSPDKELVAVAANCSHTPKPGGCGPIGPQGPKHCSSGSGGQ